MTSCFTVWPVGRIDCGIAVADARGRRSTVERRVVRDGMSIFGCAFWIMGCGDVVKVDVVGFVRWGW